MHLANTPKLYEVVRDCLAPLCAAGRDGHELLSLGGSRFVQELAALPDPERQVVLSGIWDALRSVCLAEEAAANFQSEMAQSAGGPSAENVAERLARAQRMEALAHLSSVVAHDFNNQLLTISGFTELALRSLSAGDPVEKKLQEVKAAAQRAHILTHQLQVVATRVPDTPTRIEMSDLLQELAPLFARLAGRKVQLDLVLGNQGCWVNADRSLLEQVLLTLVARAGMLMRSGGRLTIEAAELQGTTRTDLGDSGIPAGRHVLLSITDTGPGMGADELRRAFDPFLTAGGEPGGGSLELSTVHEIVTRCGGRISLQSEAATGTTFRIFLPDAAAASAAPAEAPPVEAEPAAIAAGGNELILLVEDDDSIRALARLVLQQGGYRVVEARDGGEAILLAEKSEAPVDLLLTDYSLPRITGRELYQRLQPLQPGMKVLYTSGYPRESISQPGESAESMNFLGKPFTPADLLAVVATALHRQAA